MDPNALKSKEASLFGVSRLICEQTELSPATSFLSRLSLGFLVFRILSCLKTDIPYDIISYTNFLILNDSIHKGNVFSRNYIIT